MFLARPLRTLAFPLMVFAAVPSFAGKGTCPELSVFLTGSTTHMGVVYTERLTMHKVSGGSGYSGKWLIDQLEQQIDFPWQLRPTAPTTTARADMGMGMWMNTHSRQVGPNTLLVTSTPGNCQLDVVGNRVGWAATRRFSGTITGDEMTFKFDPSSPTEPLLKGRIVRSGTSQNLELSISVLNDVSGGRFCFSEGKPGILKLMLEARVTPAAKAVDVEWTLPEIPGSKRTVEPANARGAYITVTFAKLPSSNVSFGEKAISAIVRSGACQADDRKTIKVFYPSTATNNPKGRDPNWFYYWCQTPAAKPGGHTINLVYGGRPYSFCHWQGSGTVGFFDPRLDLHRTAFICNLVQVGGATMSNRFPLISRTPAPVTGRLDGWRTTRFLDTFATVVIHENEHILIHEKWKRGKTLSMLNAEDQDGDGVPDDREHEFGFDPARKQTWLAGGETRGIGYDEEWLCYEKMGAWAPGSLDRHDWSYPGAQWP